MQIATVWFAFVLVATPFGDITLQDTQGPHETREACAARINSLVLRLQAVQGVYPKKSTCIERKTQPSETTIFIESRRTIRRIE